MQVSYAISSPRPRPGPAPSAWWSRLLARVSRAADEAPVRGRERGRRLRAVGPSYADEVAHGPGSPSRHEPPPTLTELYLARRLDMVRLALFLVDDLHTAEDVVQDAFAALCRTHGTSLGGLDDPGAYLHTAVVNAARSVLRRRRTARAYIPPHPGVGAPVDEGLLLAEEHRHVLDALAQLTRRQREVLVLRYWSELTEAQIARTLGLSCGTVKSTASRALDALEKKLEAGR
ncbi:MULTISPECIES: SigE family RNA polymerase sigma factor [unclassified Streptomyces]|uniref:RNA polymerase sigma factor n=1 Tax=unclassified Streptomyces TaxID=2593676 RepID=UPI0006F8F916|nr:MULTISPECIES: SigE family RNA polymerase sigma factor [unclassified Streptomyces]KQX57847.1 RNA polymerase [Streptomyces sp. Root1304]KRA78731.1 RNA polymerase [Streptomyces sp. Root66D1]